MANSSKSKVLSIMEYRALVSRWERTVKLAKGLAYELQTLDNQLQPWDNQKGSLCPPETRRQAIKVLRSL